MVVFCILMIGTYWLIVSEFMDCLSFNIMLCVTAVFPSALCGGVVVPREVAIRKCCQNIPKRPAQRRKSAMCEKYYVFLLFFFVFQNIFKIFTPTITHYFL